MEVNGDQMRITMQGVEFGYFSTPVLKDINLDLNGPQMISIIGPNGVGKSTLIHCINKLLSPNVGTVLVDDKDVTDITIKDMAKIVGYVPYSSSEAFPLSVVDTVMMGRHPHGSWKSLDEDLDKVYEALDLLGIRNLAMRSFDELSAGQHQKVMLARGIVQNPEILLLDEPTANLDIRHQMEVSRLLHHLSRSRNMLVVMISHDLNAASKYSDNVIMLKDGAIYAVGTPEQVLTKDNIREVYGIESEVIMSHGRPHIMILDEEFDHEDHKIPEESYTRGSSAFALEGPAVDTIR